MVKKKLIREPGTIYSDDEVECFSDQDEGLEKASMADPGNGEFYKDFFLVNEVGNFNNSLEKLIGRRKFAKKCTKNTKGGRKEKAKEKEVPFKYYSDDDDVEPGEFGEASKYVKKMKVYDMERTIEKVMKELDIELPSVEGNVVDEVDLEKSEENVMDEEGHNAKEVMIDNGPEVKCDLLKVKEKDFAKKEKKKQRKAKINEEVLQKDKELLQFEDAPPPNCNVRFKEMDICISLKKAVNQMGYDKPTPIQAATIPVALRGRDICGCAATGTGKTAAYMLPVLERLSNRPDESEVTRVLVLVPTRELGVQVFQVSKELSEFINVTISLTVGGLNMKRQGSELKKNPDIIIATPGRLIDHIHNTPSFSLSEIEILVLDEADRMLDQNFAEQLKEIVSQCCIKRQTLLFSATMTNEVKDLISVSLTKPVRVFVNNNTDVAQNLRQEFVRMRKDPDRLRPAILSYLVSTIIKDQCIVFVSQKADCHSLRILLGLQGIKVDELHGNLNQFERMRTMQKFRDKKISILLATDVAARGLDIPGVMMVINYNLPSSYENYVHRVGRTARMGLPGQSITISSDLGQDYHMLKVIQKKSLSPLYERRIIASKITVYSERVDKLEAAVDRVFELEKLYKLKMKEKSSEKSVDSDVVKVTKVKKEKKDFSKIADKKEKKVMWNGKEQNLEFIEREIQMKEENLKNYSAGNINCNAVMEKNKQNRAVREKLKAMRKKLRDKRAEQKAEIEKIVKQKNKNVDLEKLTRLKLKREEGGDSLKRKSNFDEELTQTGDRYLKKLRKGPSYLEKKEAFEAENEGKKYSFKEGNTISIDKSFNQITSENAYRDNDEKKNGFRNEKKFSKSPTSSKIMKGTKKMTSFGEKFDSKRSGGKFDSKRFGGKFDGKKSGGKFDKRSGSKFDSKKSFGKSKFKNKQTFRKK